MKSILDPTFPFAGEKADKIEPDVLPVYNAWKQDDTPKTRGAMLKHMQPMISKAVFSYAGGDVSPLINTRAKLMALHAMKSYNPQSGSMQTHILSQLRGLQRVNAQSQQIISIPERVAIDRSHLTETESKLQDDLGRPPSAAELARATGMSLQRIAYVRQAKPGINTGSILDEDGDVYSPASQIPGSTAKDDAWASMIYHDLTNTDQLIMDHTLGLHGAKTLSNTELANMLGVSAGAVSQRKAKIQQMLDARYEVDPFGGNNG